MALDKFQPYLFVSAGEQSNKYLTPVISPDGIAAFQAQRAQDLSGMTVRIDPIQEGTGDPSPTNIRPISGRTGMTVTRAGKNLLPSHAVGSTTVYGVTFDVREDGSIRVHGTATQQADFPIVPQNKLTLSPGTYTVKRTPGDNIQYVIGGASNTSGLAYTVVSKDNDATFTISNRGTTGHNILRVLSGATVDAVCYPQIEVGSTATAYEPYTGTTIPITWQTEAGTVYGGTLDVVSGVLTVDWDYIASYNGETIPGEWISDRDVYEEGTTPTTGAEVAYKLAEPVTYQLDPVQVMTVPGYNQIYSDAGPVTSIKF